MEKGQEAKRAGAVSMILQDDPELNTATADVQPIDTSNAPQAPEKESKFHKHEYLTHNK